MEYGLQSIVGKVRENDEDNILFTNFRTMAEGVDNSLTLGVVADGMGGGEKGEIASRFAVRTIARNVSEIVLDGDLSSVKIRDVMLKSITEANDLVDRYARSQGIRTIGTTVTAALIRGSEMYVINIGDSRTYLISKDGKVKRKTKDHSYVQELVDAGQITERQVRTHPQRNIVTRVVDGTGEAMPDFYQWQIYNGDAAVLCCDGMWEPLDDKVIARTAVSNGSVQDTVRLLVDTANELDGSDNISAVIMRQTEGADEQDFAEAPTKKRS